MDFFVVILFVIFHSNGLSHCLAPESAFRWPHLERFGANLSEFPGWFVSIGPNLGFQRCDSALGSELLMAAFAEVPKFRNEPQLVNSSGLGRWG
jgi:hypothetical protein